MIHEKQRKKRLVSARTSGRSSHAPVPASHLTRSISFPTSASVWKRGPRSARRNRAPRSYGGTATDAHLRRLRMCTVKASAGLRRRHVNHGGTPAAVGRQRLAIQDLLLKHLYEIHIMYVWKLMKHLKHVCIAIATCATPDQLLKHPDETFETNIWNTWNIGLQHAYIAVTNRLLQHSDETLET